MKRDLDLIRRILLDVEAAPAGEQLDHLNYGADFAHNVIAEHVDLLIDAGFIQGKVIRYLGGEGSDYLINRMTWKGHDFIDSARTDSVWLKAKEKVRSIGGSVSLDVFAELLKALAKGQLGLP